MKKDTNLLHILLFKESRKVAFGLYVFVVASVYLWLKLIVAGDWMNCVILSSVLIGGGTAVDAYFKTKTPHDNPPSQQ